MVLGKCFSPPAHRSLSVGCSPPLSLAFRVARSSPRSPSRPDFIPLRFICVASGLVLGGGFCPLRRGSVILPSPCQSPTADFARSSLASSRRLPLRSPPSAPRLASSGRSPLVG